MTEHVLLGLASIVALGIAAQWLAWCIRIPSIFLLLLLGLVAGPFTGWLQPQHLFGELLFPAMSLSVAVILFEGGLSLRIVVLRDIGHVLRDLVTLGVLVTWLITSAAAYVFLGLDGHTHRRHARGLRSNCGRSAVAACAPGRALAIDPAMGGHSHRPHGGNCSLPTSLCGEWPALSGFERFE